MIVTTLSCDLCLKVITKDLNDSRVVNGEPYRIALFAQFDDRNVSPGNASAFIVHCCSVCAGKIVASVRDLCAVLKVTLPKKADKPKPEPKPKAVPKKAVKKTRGKKKARGKK
jgi:hypothetical protein